ncbi:uncharacterized protein RCH25_044158 [Pelodytes ibericus]
MDHRLQVQIRPIIFLLLCYWSSLQTVTCFTNEQLGRTTDYIGLRYKIRGQHAYVIKFTTAQCAQVTDNDIVEALKMDTVKVVQQKVLNREIYIGTQLIMASYSELGNNKREHAEHRLLYPPPGSNISPVQNLLNKPPAAGCAMFFTLNSPCQAYCTKPNGPYNIVQKLDQFKNINNRAFVYKQVYNEPGVKVCCPTDRLKSINNKMTLHRCDRNCVLCFQNGVFNNNCIN